MEGKKEENLLVPHCAKGTLLGALLFKRLATLGVGGIVGATLLSEQVAEETAVGGLLVVLLAWSLGWCDSRGRRTRRRSVLSLAVGVDLGGEDIVGDELDVVGVDGLNIVCC